MAKKKRAATKTSGSGSVRRKKARPATTKTATPSKKKKRMTKAQQKAKAAEKWQGDQLAGSTSKFLMSCLTRAQHEYNDSNVLCAGDANKVIIGIPMPFPMEWLVENNIFPLSRMVQIDGKYGANKSSFLAEIVRWFRMSGGIGTIIENETKGAYDMALSIIGYADEHGGQECLGFMESDSVEDWQHKLQWVCNDIRTFMTKKTEANPFPPGRVFPVVIGLDSIMGKLSEETQKAIDDRGFADRAHPVEALKITQFLKKFPQDMRLWPFSFVAINHVKRKQGVMQKPGAPPPRSKQGGDHIDYQETYEIELTKIGKESYVDDNEEGFEIRSNKLKLKCYKNSLGTDLRDIEVKLIWSQRRGPNGKPRQYSYFDWDSATTDLILRLYALGGNRQKKIQDIVDIRKTKVSNETRFYSSRLQVSKGDAVPKDEIGRLLQRNEAVLDDLRDQLGIKRRKVFTSGIDYHTQVEVLRDIIETRMDD